jgi:hypothetical protein
MRYVSPSLTNVHHLGPNGDRNISGTCSVCGVTLLAWLEDSERTGPALTNRFEALFGKHVDECHPRVAPLRQMADSHHPNHSGQRHSAELLPIAG